MSDDDASLIRYEGYVPNTTHIEHNILFYTSLGVVAFSLVGLPLFAAIGKLCCRKKDNDEGEYRDDSGRSGPAKGDDSDAFVCGDDDLDGYACGADDLAYYACGCGPHPPFVDKSDISCGKRCRAALRFLSGCSTPRRGKRSNSTLTTRRRMAVSRGVAREQKMLIETGEYQEEDGEDVYYLGLGGPTCGVELVMPPDNCGLFQYDAEVSARQQVAWDDPPNTPNTPLCSLDFLQRSLLWTTICKCDYEMKRLLRLAVPYTISAMIEEVAELFVFIVVSHTCGYDAMITYIIVDIILGVTDCFTGGVIESVSSLASMAFGAYNYDLAGQYLQAACIIHVLLETSTYLAWGFNIDKVILLLGMEEEVAALSTTYVWLVASASIVGSVNGALLEFLEVIGYEVYANVVYCVHCLFEAGLVALLFLGNEAVNEAIAKLLGLVGIEAGANLHVEANLNVLGIIAVACEAFFLLLNTWISLSKGWLKKFEDGIFRQFSLKNMSTLKELFKVAVPLMFSGLLSYAEWEILIVFAAILGPAEAVTWGILGCLWDFFESTTGAISEASEVRCAYHLGKGQPEMARLSAYKSIFLSLIMSILVTGVFVGTCHLYPAWLTDDETIQTMLEEAFPLVAVGNVMMNMGMVCCALVGAQGRYRLATIIAVSCSLFITVPLGALMTVWWRIDLEGLTFAVLMGYTAESAILSVVILMSDWERLSKKIQGKMGAKGWSSDDDTESDDTREEGISELGYTPADIPAVIHKKKQSLMHSDRTDGRTILGSGADQVSKRQIWGKTQSLIQTNSNDSEASNASEVSKMTQGSKISLVSEISKRSGASRETHASKISQMSEKSKRSGASRKTHESKISQMSEKSKRSGASRKTHESKISQVSEKSKRSGASRETQASKISQVSETSKRSGASRETHASKISQVSETSKRSGATRASQASKISQVSETSKRSGASHASKISQVSEKSKRSGATRASQASKISQVNETSKRSGVSRGTQASNKSQASEVSKRSGASRATKASSMSHKSNMSEGSGVSRETKGSKTSQTSEASSASKQGAAQMFEIV